MLPLDLFAAMFLLAQMLFTIATIVFAISAVDDLIFDAVFFICHRRGKVDPRQPGKTITLEDITDCKEQPLAIMLPAWQEADVLIHSVKNMIHKIRYNNYYVFIGTYPNDPDTQAQADLLCSEFKRVRKVVTPLPGPTCKADCLNAIIKAIKTYEQESGICFAGYILQDAEDIVHPHSLQVYNYFLPHFELIQIPVLSLPRHWYNLTAGHYMDEFAEVHSKEIFSRQYVAGIVPGAGVGTAYSTQAIRLASDAGEIFNTSSLTEDYDFSFRSKSRGAKHIFARIEIPSTDKATHAEYESPNHREIIATREFFPSSFWAAVRQKTRWFIGISLQGWELLGWHGSWATRYLFWRDRKMLFFSHAIVAGLVSFSIFMAFSCYHIIDPQGYRMAPLVADNHPVWHVVYFNLCVLLHRILQRCWWTYRCYGLSAIALVLPRYVWGSVVNYFATIRAIRIYISHRITGRTIGWDKTSHEFPKQFQQPITWIPPGSSPLPSANEPV